MRVTEVSTLPALLYHAIGDPQPGSPSDLVVSSRRFTRQIEYLLRHGYTTAGTEDCLRFLRGDPLARQSVILTFDDAYASLCDEALPLLIEHGLSAIVFVVTEQIGGTNVWERADAAATRLMSAEQIRNWAARGIEFGAHSRTHANLALLDGTDLESEIAGSVRDLEELLDRPVNAFAYPYGYISEPARAAAAQACPLCFSTIEGLNRSSTDASLLRRTMVLPSDTTLDLMLMLRSGTSPRTRLRKLAGRVTRRLSRRD